MPDLTEQILELVRIAATDLPPDVEQSLRRSVENEARVRRRAAPWKRS